MIGESARGAVGYTPPVRGAPPLRPLRVGTIEHDGFPRVTLEPERVEAVRPKIRANRNGHVPRLASFRASGANRGGGLWAATRLPAQRPRN